MARGSGLPKQESGGDRQRRHRRYAGSRHGGRDRAYHHAATLPVLYFSVPAYDKFSEWLDRVLPSGWVYRMARWRNIKLQRLIYLLAKKYPDFTRKLLLSNVRRHVGKDFDMTHFQPVYQPWDERLCAVPDADLFRDLREGKADIVTDHIDTFTENGIRLKSGRELEADIIVTATGLNLQVLGGMELSIDGAPWMSVNG